MSFPGVSGGASVPRGGDLTGMNEQEQQVVKAVRQHGLLPPNSTMLISCSSSRCRQLWTAVLARPLRLASLALPWVAHLDFSCQVYGAYSLSAAIVAYG